MNHPVRTGGVMAAATLRAVYPPGGPLCGEPPTAYRVTALGGALVAECRTLEAAQRFLDRWTTANVVCAWCGIGLRYEPTLEPGQVSHGACESCVRNLTDEKV